MSEMSPPISPMPEIPPPKGWILVTDCPCGEHHLAPDNEGYQACSDYIDSDGVFHECA